MREMAIELWQIDRVRPFENNPRTHDAGDIAKTAKSLKAFGWRQPIVVDEDGVFIAGHGRLLAAKSLGQEKVPVHVASGLQPRRPRLTA